MKVYKYPFYAQLIYKYANFPITIILLLYFIMSMIAMRVNPWYIIGGIIHGMFIFLINRYYFRSYRFFPYKIEIDDMKIICSDFFLMNKKIIIDINEITDITGGIFSNRPSRPIYIIGKDENQKIGVYIHLEKYNEFLTYILAKVPKKKYDELVGKIKELGDEFKQNRKKKGAEK